MQTVTNSPVPLPLPVQPNATSTDQTAVISPPIVTPPPRTSSLLRRVQPNVIPTYSERDEMDVVVYETKIIANRSELHALKARLKVAKEIAGHPEQYEPKQHEFAAKEIAQNHSKFEANQVVWAVKIIIQQPKSYSLEDCKFAAQHIVSNHQGYSAVEHGLAARHIMKHFDQYDLQQRVRAVRYVMRHPQLHTVDQYLYAINQITENPSSYSKEDGAFALKIRRHFEDDVQKERTQIPVAVKQKADVQKKHAQITATVKQIVTNSSSGDVDNAQRNAAKYIMGHPGSYTADEYAWAVKHITKNPQSYTDAEYKYAAAIKKNMESQTNELARVATVKQVSQNPEKYSADACTYAVRHILEDLEQNSMKNYTIQDFVWATKQVIGHPECYSEEEFNLVARKMVNYCGNFNAQTSLYSEKDISDAARIFVNYNMTFFSAPIDDQAEFVRIFEKKNQRQEVEKYSAGLVEFLDSTRGTIPGMPFRSLLGLWVEKRFEVVLDLEVKVALFILKNMKHGAVKFWNESGKEAWLNAEHERTVI